MNRGRPGSGSPAHIAVFIPSLAVGGAEGVILALVNGFAQAGLEVTLLLARAAGPLIDRLDPAVEVQEMGGAGVMRAIPHLARFLRKRRPDALLSAMTHANIAAALARVLSRRRDVRLVLAERMSLAARDTFYASGGERIVRALMPLLYRVADLIVVPTEQMLAPLAAHTRLPVSRFRVIGNPVVDARFAARASEDWPLGASLVVDGSKVVLAVGRLTAVKDFPLLIRAFAGIASRRDAHLVILGEGEERRALAKLEEEQGLAAKVHLPGYDTNPLAAMKAADVFVLSSRYEGLPNVLIQALACGTRAVSTDCATGPSDILENGRWGLLVPVGDIVAMQGAIEHALDAPEWFDLSERPNSFTVENAVNGFLDALLPAKRPGAR
jgi:glycosyltransferase involved in cell wall biosynthesis